MYDMDDYMEAALEQGMDLDPHQLSGLFETAASGVTGGASALQAWMERQGELSAGQSAPYGETPPGFTWPAAVPMRPQNWNFDTEPDSYKIALGDTFAGLSATYLGTPMRWREIWNIQPDQYRYSRSPDRIMPGEWIFMPPDATATLLAAYGEPPPPGATPAPEPPGGYPTPVGPAPKGAPPGVGPEPTTTKKKSILPWVIGGGAAAALAAYALT